MAKIVKINDLTNSPLRKKFLDEEFVPETNLAVAMGRVSIKKNKDKGHSDDAQLERIEEYLLKKGLVLACEAWDVPETGFKHEKRKKFIQMLDVVRTSQVTKNPIKHIIFSHQSRSNRNRESAREIEALIRTYDVTLHCVRDNLILTRVSPLEDWMRWDIFNNLNEKSSTDHKKNVMDGVIKRLELGLYPGKPPFGYKNYRPSEDETSIFIFREGADKFMRLAFEWLVTGNYSVMDLARKLHEKFPELPKKPDHKRLGEIMRNPFYYGDFIWDGIQYKGDPELHPALISFDLWQKVQDILNGGPRKARHGEHPYLELIRCGGFILDENGKETDEPCGCAITAEAPKKKLADGTWVKYPQYRCSNSTRDCSQRDKVYMREACKHTIGYPQAEIERLFRAVFSPMAFTDEDRKWMQGYLLQEHQRRSQDHRQHLAALQRRYTMLKSHIDAAYEDKLSGDLSEEDWREKNTRWQFERTKIENEIRSLNRDEQDYIQKGVLLIELAQRTESVYENGSSDVKRKLVEIVSSNHVLKDGTLRFEYKKPFDLLSRTASKEIWWT